MVEDEDTSISTPLQRTSIIPKFPNNPSSLLNQILTVHFHPFRLSLIQHTDQSSFFHPLENPFSHSLRIDTPVGKSIEIIILADFNIFPFDELYFVVKPHYLHITHTSREGYDEISKEKKYIYSLFYSSLLKFSLSLSIPLRKILNSKFSG